LNYLRASSNNSNNNVSKPFKQTSTSRSDKKSGRYINYGQPEESLENYGNSYENENVYNKQSTKFPTQEKIPNEHIRDIYSNLLTAFNKIDSEKEQLLESLRRETITNEEQKSYIEVLKQTLESSIFSSGLSKTIKNQK